MRASMPLPPRGSWIDQWDAMFARFDPNRSLKFQLILDLLTARRLRRFTLLDLGSGPGVFARQVLVRFPAARVIGLDQGPLVLRMGEEALSAFGPRMRWVQADLRTPGWKNRLPTRHIDVVVSSLCLHGLPPEDLARTYRVLGTLVRPNGLFIDADLIAGGSGQESFALLIERIGRLEAQRGARGTSRQLSVDARGFWRRVRQSGAMPELFAEHDARRKSEEAARRQAKPRPEHFVGLETHLAYLRGAGFREATVMWQHLNMRMLVAIR